MPLFRRVNTTSEAGDIPGSIQRRARELFAREQTSLAVQTDHGFSWLMLAQWLAGIAAAFWISPRTWIGGVSQTHLHVYAAIFLGGIIASLPVILAWTKPGHVVTRHVIAAGQMLASAVQ